MKNSNAERQMIDAPIELFGRCIIDIQTPAGTVEVRGCRVDTETLYWIQALADECGGDLRAAFTAMTQSESTCQ